MRHRVRVVQRNGGLFERRKLASVKCSCCAVVLHVQICKSSLSAHTPSHSLRNCTHVVHQAECGRPAARRNAQTSPHSDVELIAVLMNKPIAPVILERTEALLVLLVRAQVDGRYLARHVSCILTIWSSAVFSGGWVLAVLCHILCAKDYLVLDRIYACGKVVDTRAEGPNLRCLGADVRVFRRLVLENAKKGRNTSVHLPIFLSTAEARQLE
jgi:hypothetical protein